MSQKPDKPVQKTPPAPAISRVELICTAVFLSLCLGLDAWIGAPAPVAQKPAVAPKRAAPAPPEATPAPAFSRPERERPDSRERQWRDPLSGALPNL